MGNGAEAVEHRQRGAHKDRRKATGATATRGETPAIPLASERSENAIRVARPPAVPATPSGTRERVPPVLASGPMLRVATKSPPTLRVRLRRAGRGARRRRAAYSRRPGSAWRRWARTNCPPTSASRPVVAEANFPVALAWTPRRPPALHREVRGPAPGGERATARRAVRRVRGRRPLRAWVDRRRRRSRFRLQRPRVRLLHPRRHRGAIASCGCAKSMDLASSPPSCWMSPTPPAPRFTTAATCTSGPDGYLYVTLGENHDAGLAPRLDTPLGKILRIDKADGERAARQSLLRRRAIRRPATTTASGRWACATASTSPSTRIRARCSPPKTVPTATTNSTASSGAATSAGGPSSPATTPTSDSPPRCGASATPLRPRASPSIAAACSCAPGIPASSCASEATDSTYRELIAVESWGRHPLPGRPSRPAPTARST